MLEVRLLMKTNKLIALIALLIVLLSLSLSTASAQEELPVVHAIMFYSPYCPHCEKVINQDLPPLFDQYGDQLVVVGIDVTNDAGSELFYKTLEFIDFPVAGCNTTNDQYQRNTQGAP